MTLFHLAGPSLLVVVLFLLSTPITWAMAIGALGASTKGVIQDGIASGAFTNAQISISSRSAVPTSTSEILTSGLAVTESTIDS